MNDTPFRTARDALAPYQRPQLRRGLVELLVTTLPLAAFWTLAVLSVGRGWWWGLLLILPAAAFLVRLFMIQHDCGHNAFFASARLNAWTGRIIGVLTMTPYAYWRRTHAIHHATSGNLDRRGLGAIEMLTVQEYGALSPLRRRLYRLYRHPLVLFGVGPAYMFILQHRLPIGLLKEGWAWKSVMGANLALALLVLPLILLAGPTAVLLVHVPMMVLAASIGVWLFYVQHQFEDAYWARNDTWTLREAALRGSSYLKLPRILDWLTAHIGAHHLHHANMKIPFYRFPEVLKEQPQFGQVRPLTLREAFKGWRLALWDEGAGRLISFQEARAVIRA